MSGAIAVESRESAIADLSEQTPEPQGVSMFVFSGDLDSALAAFIIANGAAAMDLPVTMFFPFWAPTCYARKDPSPSRSRRPRRRRCSAG